VRLAEADAAVNEQRVVSFARIFTDSDARGVRETIARAGDEIFERVIGIEKQRLIAFIEDSAARKIVAVKRHRDETVGDLLRGVGERLLALVLAEVQLRGRLNGRLNHAVGDSARDELIEPDSIQARMLRADVFEDFLPDGWIESSRFNGAARGRPG
jgi:hypothetical protein